MVTAWRPDHVLASDCGKLRNLDHQALGTGERKITSGRATEALQGWSPMANGSYFASSRMGYKDEVIYTDAPQPYGEIFVMRYDGKNVSN